MTPKEASAARVQFLVEHPELSDKPKELAEALKADGLYSENTSIRQICKFLPGLLKKAAAA